MQSSPWNNGIYKNTCMHQKPRIPRGKSIKKDKLQLVVVGLALGEKIISSLYDMRRL
jgi:hypothetical protein